MKRVVQFGMTPNYGGVEAFIMNLYRNLNHEEIQFDFFVNSNSSISYEDEIKLLGGRIIHQRFVSRKKNPFKHYKELFQYFKKNPDIIAVHLNKANIRDIDLLIVAKLMKIPVRIIHSHIDNRLQKLQFFEKINQKLLKCVTTHLLACSHEAGNYMFGKLDYQVIKDGVNIQKFQFNKLYRSQIRKQLNILDDEFVVGSIGRFCEQKNTLFLLDIFFEIYKEDKNSKLLLIGNGPLKTEVNKKIYDFNLQNNVILIDETIEANKYYSAMDIFLFPSLYEGFGMVLLEAQISGLKCIASKDVIPELVDITKEIEYVSLTSTAKWWANCVSKYKKIKRYDKVNLVINAGFDINDIAEQLEKIYREGEINE